MKYSVVVPVFLREESHKKLINETVGNIKQMSGNYELIIVDDGSPLSTEWLLDIADVYLKHDKNKGISEAWNTGKNRASNECVAIVNDDIKVPLGWLETLAKAFNDPDTGVSAPLQGGPFVKPYKTSYPYLEEDYSFYPGYCFMLKKDRFFEDFDPQFKTNCGDSDYWHRIKSADLRCMRVGLGVWHKEGGVLHGMNYDKITQDSLALFENKWGFDPRGVYYK